MDGMKNIRCPLCNSDDSEIICAKAGLKMGKAQDITNVICNKCGLIYNNPMPSEETLEGWYKKDFLEDTSGTDDYYSYTELLRVKNGREKNKRIVNFIQPFIKENGSVIDMGCSDGSLLFEIKNQCHCRVKGVEPNPVAARVAKEYHGLKNIENIFLEDYIKNTDEKFDFVILRYVLEHLREINNIIDELKILLNDNGYLFLVIPNAANFRPSRRLEFCLEFGHLHSFTPYTIHQLLLKHGMKIVKWSYDRIFLGMQIVATSVDNPVDAVPAKEMKDGLDIERLKKKLRNQKYRHFLFRLKRKIKNILRLRWKSY